MPNITSWTETEVNILVQAWSDMEAKNPWMIHSREASALHSKVYALFSKRCTFPRSTLAVKQMKNHLRNVVLFVHKFDEDRRKRGERIWYDLSLEERRALAPAKLWCLALALNRKAYARLLTMERAQRWVGEGNAGKNDNQRDGGKGSFISPVSESSRPDSFDNEFTSLSASSTPSTEQGGDKGEGQLPAAMPQRAQFSPTSSVGDGLFAAKSHGESDESKDFPTKLKHRDCNILLENMIKLQAKKMHKSMAKLRTDVEGDIQRSSEMLLSIINNQFEDTQSSGDVAFMTKVLGMQKQQITGQFERFEEKRTREEAATRALIE
ncbi:hypothetical protein V7S43_013299 [Phytophthora oleae]|uniref:No apical meristem-associated C-terminal domain-containing protein n=1 Tax=Phytophthora oleae TaxID=2107226 RepID=A0ABD3F7Q6_9STRA